MKREYIAAVLLAALVVTSAWCIRKIDALTDEICLRAQAAERAASDPETAERELRQGLELWLANEGYTHVFIRHSEIDACTDAFYEALSTLPDGEADAFASACEKLVYHMRSVSGMEHVTLGSIM